MTSDLVEDAEERWLSFLATYSHQERLLKDATMIHLGYLNALYDIRAITRTEYENARSKVIYVIKQMKWEHTILTLDKNK